MNDLVAESPPDANAVSHALADLDRRVQSLETKVAALPDEKQIEDRVTEKVKAGLPPPPPPVDPTAAPSFRDFEIPIPNMQTVVATAKTTWMFFEMLGELKMLFWTLFDRRYHMAWITRFVTIVLLILIVTAEWWVPFARIDYLGWVVTKIAEFVLGLILFLVLSFETRRYKEWRSKR